jgi:hypothetical protein
MVANSMRGINPDSNLVGSSDWWVNGKLKFLILICGWHLPGGEILATIVPNPGGTVLGVLESDLADGSIGAAAVSSLL